MGVNRIALMLGAMKPVPDLNIAKRMSSEMVNRKVKLIFVIKKGSGNKIQLLLL